VKPHGELVDDQRDDGIIHRAPPFTERRVRAVIGNGVNGTPKISA
jgi:hypothetical protein